MYRARRTGARQHRPPNLHVNDQQRRPKLRGRMRFDARHRRYCKSDGLFKSRPQRRCFLARRVVFNDSWNRIYPRVHCANADQNVRRVRVDSGGRAVRRGPQDSLSLGAFSFCKNIKLLPGLLGFSGNTRP